MATISIYIPDSDVNRVYDAIANNYRYQSTSRDGEGNSIPNPQSKAEFTNSIVQGFLGEHVKVYELEKARQTAEAAISGAGNVSVQDGSTATAYEYDMVCLAAAKDQYDGLASIIAPGNTFHIPLSANGQEPVTHYGSEVAVTETARQQLRVLELAGGTSTNGVQTLFYTRCTPVTDIAVATNIAGYDIIGKPCAFSDLISHMGLQVIAPPTPASGV
jgi:hypothetical protein